MAQLVLENLTKCFKGARGEELPAVDCATLTVEAKELLVLVGPSGSGKTTLLRLIAGLDEPSQGTIRLDGQDLAGVPPAQRDVAMVFQRDALYPHLTVRENIGFGLAVRKYPRAEIERRVAEAARWLDLGGCLERHPQELSSGQRQRAALGRAIVRQPKLFLLDEPLSSLDAPLRLQLRAEIARLHRKLEATMIYVTHDQAEAMTLGERIAVMKEGRIQQVAAPLEIYRRPANLFVAGFLGTPPMNLLCGRLVANDGGVLFEEQCAPGAPGQVRLRLDTRQLSAGYIGKEVVLGIRPEDVRLQAAAKTAEPAQLEATVELLEPTGPETFVHATTAAHSVVARAPAATALRLRQKVGLELDLAKAHFFDPTTSAPLDSVG